MRLFNAIRLAGAGFRHGFRASDNELRVTTVEDLAKALQLANGGGPSKSGATVTATSAQRVSAVFRAVQLLSESVAQLPLVLYTKKGKARVPAEGTPLYRLMHARPNPWQTSFEFRELMQRDLLLAGNAYSYMVPGTRGPQELLRLHPDLTTPKQDPNTLAVTYEYRRPDGRGTQVFSADQVMHLRGPGDDGLMGKNPMAYFREVIGDAIALQEHGSRFFSNGAKPATAITVEKGFDLSDDESRKALREDWDSTYAGGANAHRTAFLPAGFSIAPVGINMKDAQWIEGRKFQVTDIARIFGVPPHMLGDLERATFSNIEQQGINFVTYSLNPWLVRLEQVLNRDLLNNDDRRYFKFTTNALMRGDFKTRQEGLQIQRRGGVISANEWRGLEDMNPRTDPGGDDYIVEQNMRPDDGRDPVAAGPAEAMAPNQPPAPEEDQDDDD